MISLLYSHNNNNNNTCNLFILHRRSIFFNIKYKKAYNKNFDFSFMDKVTKLLLLFIVLLN